MKLEYNGYKFNILGAEITNTSLQVSIPDSFVKSNKFSWTTGNGEARLYICGRKEATVFFGKEFVENDEYRLAFVIKDDLEAYLLSAEFEYTYPQNHYRRQNDMIERYEQYKKSIEKMNEIEYFYIKNHNGKKDKSRFYIDGYEIDSFPPNRSNIYNFLREILLPQITDMQIIKVIDKEEDNKILYWFRPYLSEFTRLKHPRIIEEEEKKIRDNTRITEKQKQELIKSRIGQGEFRKKCLDRYESKCVVTGLDQKEIIEACHIKPWMDSTDDERLDVNNSIALTSTLHKLFDLGFITFDENYNLMSSSFVTYKMNKFLEKYYNKSFIHELKSSENYLKYHRENIYRD